MKTVVYIIITAVMIFGLTSSSTDFIEASTKSVFYTTEYGSITIDHEQYLKPKYVHEPIQLHISGTIENYQRAESTQMTITSPSGDVIENVICPTREGEFDFISQITSNHSTGQYEIRVIHKEMIIGPAMFKIITETENELKIQNIPSWVKNNAGWWAQGQIGTSDFLKGVQFLVEQGIIKLA
ncbi:MAG: hypothetical protein OEM77_05670 [Nitrosopumilus sp.]|nr:hypothetical protein [Nitrosopumilus sp.]MDH3735424.1 hypothetical protein [Nitrosopumilus sp.]MDH3823269.1 hypothetical protein [Nitrosopumilus sp.]MDH3832542.1 hypothetical protein [Nitrosopumilus sp.]